MKTNKLFRRNNAPTANVDGTLQHDSIALLAGLLLVGGSFGLLAAGHLLTTQVLGGILNPGDILYADSGNAIEGGFIIKVDPVTREQTVVSAGGNLHQPFDLVIDSDGGIIVSDTSGCLIRILPDTWQQTVMAQNSNGTLGMPCGIALSPSGEVLVANTQALRSCPRASPCW